MVGGGVGLKWILGKKGGGRGLWKKREKKKKKNKFSSSVSFVSAMRVPEFVDWSTERRGVFVLLLSLNIDSRPPESYTLPTLTTTFDKAYWFAQDILLPDL